METLAEVMYEYQTQEKITSNEGSTGVQNLCLLVRGMGYQNAFNSMQYGKGRIGDLIAFLEDNPGCIEAIKDWIAEQEIDDWKENLLSELPEKEEDED